METTKLVLLDSLLQESDEVLFLLNILLILLFLWCTSSDFSINLYKLALNGIFGGRVASDWVLSEPASSRPKMVPNLYDVTPDHSILKNGLAKSLSQVHLDQPGMEIYELSRVVSTSMMAPD